ncbi:head-tail adaptor [Microcystis phage Mae-JY02]
MIGQLDQRVTLQRYAETPDGGGGATRTWASLAQTPTVWAHVKPRLGSERMEEGRMNAAAFATFTIRYRDDITELDRIVWKGEAWNIRRIMRVSQRNQYLEVDAERGVAS